MPIANINTANRPVVRLDFSAQSWLYIGKLWAHRKQRRVRDLIKVHCERIRRWKSGEVGSLGMGFGPRDVDCGDGGMV